MLYNGMIHNLVGYPIRGAIWYQGESNHAEGMLYFEKKKALINGWRELWKQGDFPFYYVRLRRSSTVAKTPQFWRSSGRLRRQSSNLPEHGMVVINDIATLNDIHPPNKQDVGKRLALLALKHDYGHEVTVAHSPTLESLELLRDRLKVTFTKPGAV